jgi:hypothetical protein
MDKLMVRLERAVTVASGWFNYAACLAVVVMMLLSCADVALRLFGAPIPGAYEMVGFLGAVIVSFALAYTSLQRGHVAVEVIFEKLPMKAQCFVDAAGNLTGAVLFARISDDYKRKILGLNARDVLGITTRNQVSSRNLVSGFHYRTCQKLLHKRPAFQ